MRLAPNAVADEVGDLPLGLAQAAATIAGRQLTYAAYLELLLRVPVEKVLGRAAGDEYPRSAAAALLLSIESAESAEEADVAAVTSLVLRVVASLSPDGVRRRFLNGLMADDSGGLVGVAVQRCTEGSLLTWSEAGDLVIMHRLVGRVLRERDQAVGRWAETVSAALALLEPLLSAELEAQVLSRRAAGEELETQVLSRRAAAEELAAQLDALGETDAAAGTADRELAVWLLEARLQAHVQLGAVMQLGLPIFQNSLAGERQAAGRLDEAISLYEKALTGYERLLGPSHPDTLGARHNLAGAYEAAGRRPGDAVPSA